MRTDFIPIPRHLREHIACIRTANHTSTQQLAIHVCLNGLPGLVFQHHDGHSPIETITTLSGHATEIPTLYVYGQMTEPGTMNYKAEPFRTIQIVLKPHALPVLFGINASILTNNIVELNEFSSEDLTGRLLDTDDEQKQIRLLTEFLSIQLQKMRTEDRLVEEGLHLIDRYCGSIRVQNLLDKLSISERQFERRFRQTVGLTPQFYIRVHRFKAAVQLMKSGHMNRLGDIAHTLNFYDQSHFIRDIKAFSGITPKSLSQKVTDFRLNQSVIAYS